MKLLGSRIEETLVQVCCIFLIQPKGSRKYRWTTFVLLRKWTSSISAL